MMRTLFAATALAAIVTACGSSPTFGVVQRKQYTPAHQTQTTQCVAQNKKGWCTASTPVYHHYDATYEIYVSDPKLGSDWIDVTSAEYERAQPGMKWTKDGGLQ